MNELRVPVLIVGGGPVGLSTAIGLRRFGIDCLLVERHPSTSRFPKGRGINKRTMEIFRQWGIEDKVTAAGLPREESLSIYLGDTLTASTFRRYPWSERVGSGFSPTEHFVCSQDVLEPVLRGHAEALGAELRFGTRLLEFDQNNDGVCAELRAPDGGALRVRCDYLVAADGGHGTVREQLGIPVQGPGLVGGPTISILVETDLGLVVADRRSGLYWLRQPPPGAVFAVVDNDQRWLLMHSFDRAVADEDSFTDERCIALVRAAVGDPSLAVRFVGRQFWQPQAVIAERFRAGRVFLAGDAAHLTTPMGGLGMNCGIADAHNLAWKLAAVLGGWGGPPLLDSYEPERRPVARWCMETSVRLQDEPEGQRRRLLDGIVLGYDYQSEMVVPDGTAAPAVNDPLREYVPVARPGHRAPHVWCEQDGVRTSTLDLFGDAFVVLTDPTGWNGLDAVIEAADDWKAPMQWHAIDAVGWLDVYGLQPGGMVLVRPDGHVAWRSAETPKDIMLKLREAVDQATGAGSFDSHRSISIS
jgi:2-polyprenyl-6-methoxyphenol hydroxylase-like FAD-dependent oxidoreductase